MGVFHQNPPKFSQLSPLLQKSDPIYIEIDGSLQIHMHIQIKTCIIVQWLKTNIEKQCVLGL